MRLEIDINYTLWYSEKAGISLPQALWVAIVFAALVYMIKFDTYVLEEAMNAKFEITNQKLDQLLELVQK